MIWHFKGQKNNPYQTEHDLLFDAIRNDKPYNEAERCAKSNLTAIMGRMACESGQKITWDDAMASNLELAPGLETMTAESQSAGHARCQRPLSDRQTRPDESALRPLRMILLTNMDVYKETHGRAFEYC